MPEVVAGVAEDICQFASELIRIPSQAGVEPPEPILTCMAAWLHANGLTAQLLTDEQGASVGLLVEIAGHAPGPAICLNACLDTAPFGDPTRWRWPPTSGEIADGKLWGRGSADSKTGAAIIASVGAQLQREGLRRGRLVLLFDADEHSGAFGGVRALLRFLREPLDGAVLAYPGSGKITVGSRGFLRVRIVVAGNTSHSGATRRSDANAIVRMASLIQALDAAALPPEPDPSFGLDPSLTITQIAGGQGFSQVPDRAEIGVDIRLTPGFGAEAAEAWVSDLVAGFDPRSSALPASSVSVVDHWPPYQTPTGHPLVRAFADAGARAFGTPMRMEVSGPSNIGNVLYAQGIATIIGPGVGYQNLHANDEAVLIADIPRVRATYVDAVRTFLDADIVHRGCERRLPADIGT